jgi:hypothetical protein
MGKLILLTAQVQHVTSITQGQQAIIIFIQSSLCEEVKIQINFSKNTTNDSTNKWSFTGGARGGLESSGSMVQ